MVSPSKKNFVNPMNLLRTIATLCVFLLHVQLFTDASFVNRPFFFIFRTPAWAGCWMLFILGGYLSGLSFRNNRYDFSFRGITRYYLNRVRKTIFPTFCFIFLCLVFVFPSYISENPNVIFRFITLTYNGTPGADGVGATWFVFTMAWFYLLSPFVSLFVRKIQSCQSLLLGVIIFLGIGGYLWRLYLIRNGFDWYNCVYTAFYSNIDLYFSGFLMAYFVSNQSRNFSIIIKAVAFLLLIVVIISNCWFYVYRVDIYQMYYPTIYIFVILVYIEVFHQDNLLSTHNKPTKEDLCANHFRIIDVFSNYSFEFYLFHSLVLHCISPFIHVGGSFANYLVLGVIAFIISQICAYGFHRIFESKKGFSKD